MLAVLLPVFSSPIPWAVQPLTLVRTIFSALSLSSSLFDSKHMPCYQEVWVKHKPPIYSLSR